MNTNSSRTLDDVPFRIDHPTRIPAKRYYDEEFYRLECEHFWPHVWQMACRLEEIPEVGDWTEYTILDKSVIVLRAADGFKAFHNACRHRGVRLVGGDGNCAQSGFVCPFHGWRWNMEGENTFVYGRHKFDPAELDPAEIALVPCRVDTWGGAAFINFDDDAPPLLDFIGPFAARQDARNVGDLKVEWWRSAILPVNWKLAMEGFMESYHVMETHPQLFSVAPPELLGQYGSPSASGPVVTESQTAREYIDGLIAFMEKNGEGMGGMIHPSEIEIARSLRDMELPEGDTAVGAMAFGASVCAEITRQGRARGLPMPDLNEAFANHPVVAVDYAFPNFFLLPFYSAASSYRIRPLGPETCLFEMWSLAHLADDDPREPLERPEPLRHDDPSFPEVPRQDYANLPIQQLGLHATGFEFMRLSRDVEGLISNYQRIVDGYLGGIPHDKLARASAATCAGIDTPVIDLGF